MPCTKGRSFEKFSMQRGRGRKKVEGNRLRLKARESLKERTILLNKAPLSTKFTPHVESGWTREGLTAGRGNID